MNTKFKLKEGINHCTNSQYHEDKSYLSSSSLKTLLKDLDAFYKEYILLEKPERKSSNAFDEGTYAHSILLEPEEIKNEFRFFDGWRKAGKDWIAFKEKNSDYIILSTPQRKRVEAWTQTAKDLPAAMEILSGGESEYSVATTLQGVKLKARADYINLDKGYIADVKTTAHPTDVDSFTYTCDQYMYQLSAALYCMLFEAHYGKPFDFYFVVLGKTDKKCEVYKLGQKSMHGGRIKVLEALKLYNNCLKTGNWLTEEKVCDIIETDYLIKEI